MCSTDRRSRSLGNIFTNWSQPMPWPEKLAKTARNAWLRLARPGLCCGHPGEPGC